MIWFGFSGWFGGNSGFGRLLLRLEFDGADFPDYLFELFFAFIVVFAFGDGNSILPELSREMTAWFGYDNEAAVWQFFIYLGGKVQGCDVGDGLQLFLHVLCGFGDLDWRLGDAEECLCVLLCAGRAHIVRWLGSVVPGLISVAGLLHQLGYKKTGRVELVGGDLGTGCGGEKTESCERKAEDARANVKSCG